MVTRLLAVALAVLVAACESAAPASGKPEARPASTLSPGPVVRGAFVSTGAFVPLRAPIAVAASGPDLFVVDAAAGQLLRIDPIGGRMVQFSGRPTLPGTRLAVDADGSLYVLDPVNRRVQRYARDGQLLQSFATDATVSSLRDLVPDPRRGRLLAVDTLNRQLVAFRPLGISFELLPLRSEPRYTLQSIDGLAVGADALYAIDARCACLARLSYDGRVLSTFAHQQVVRPERIVADRDGRLFVLDTGARALKVFAGEELLESVDLAAQGILEATDIAYSQGWLYVSDAAGAQVKMFRVQPPSKSPRQ